MFLVHKSGVGGQSILLIVITNTHLPSMLQVYSSISIKDIGKHHFGVSSVQEGSCQEKLLFWPNVHVELQSNEFIMH